MRVIEQINLSFWGIENLSDLLLLSIFRDLIESVINLSLSFILNHFLRCFAYLRVVNLTANCSLFLFNNHILLHCFILFMSLLVIKDFIPSSLLTLSGICLRSKSAFFHFFLFILLFKKFDFLSFVFLEILYSFFCSLFQFFLQFCFSLHF